MACAIMSRYPKSPDMSPELSPEPRSSSVDVRSLSLVQLQKLAERGSRRARAELEGRMRAQARGAAPAAAPRAPSAAAPAVDLLRAPPAPSPSPPPAASIPTLTVRADGAAVAPANAPGQPSEALVNQLHLIAQQDQARARADGPPRLIGMVLMAWGALLVLSGMVMLAHGGGLYYVFCGLGSAAVGWLLLGCSRWAMALHGALLLVALGWAWAGQERPSLGVALVQAAPLLVAAAWMALRSVREPLE